jgi:hypothetical protein
MKFKTIILIILAIFFLGIVIYDFIITKKCIEGYKTLTEEDQENKNVITCINYLRNRRADHNVNGTEDSIILININNLGTIGSTEFNETIRGIINDVNKTPKIKVDELDSIFGIPSYDPLLDSLVIWYDFSTILSSGSSGYIENKSLNPSDPSLYDSLILIGDRSEQNIGNILENSNIINRKTTCLKLLGKSTKSQTNGTWLVINKFPTCYNGTSNTSIFLGLTFSVWFNTNTESKNSCRLFEFGPTDAIYCYIENSNLSFAIKNGSNSISTVLDNINVLNNKWFHLVWIIGTKGTWQIYLNNELMADLKIGIPSNIPRTIGYIGASGADVSLYNGKIADFRVYERPITLIEVNKLYNIGNIASNDLPIRKGPNLIYNGCFFSPKLVGFAQALVPTDWSADRNVLVVNIPNGGYSTNGIIVHDNKNYYSSQLGLISNFGTNFTNPGGSLKQSNIDVFPNTTYELSFFYSLYVGSSHSNDVYLTVRFGCHVLDGSNKNIVPVKNTWKKYEKTFTTDDKCIRDTIKISLNSPTQNNGDTTCAITNVSVRII